MYFDPMHLPIFVFPSESMSAILVYVAISIRSASIAVVDHILVAALKMMRNEVPHIIGIFKASSRVSFSRVSQVCKFNRILHPEDRC